MPRPKKLENEKVSKRSFSLPPELSNWLDFRFPENKRSAAVADGLQLLKDQDGALENTDQQAKSTERSA